MTCRACRAYCDKVPVYDIIWPGRRAAAAGNVGTAASFGVQSCGLPCSAVCCCKCIIAESELLLLLLLATGLGVGVWHYRSPAALQTAAVVSNPLPPLVTTVHSPPPNTHRQACTHPSPSKLKLHSHSFQYHGSYPNMPRKLSAAGFGCRTVHPSCPAHRSCCQPQPFATLRLPRTPPPSLYPPSPSKPTLHSHSFQSRGS